MKDTEYFIERGAPQSGRYLVSHVFDRRHGKAFLGSVTKTDAGWTAECHDIAIEGLSRTRGEACDKVFEQWKSAYSKEALEQRFAGRTAGGHVVRFIHSLPRAVVATCFESPGKGFTGSWGWDGKYSCADDVNGVRDTRFDLVALSPEMSKRMADRVRARDNGSPSKSTP